MSDFWWKPGHFGSYAMRLWILNLVFCLASSATTQTGRGEEAPHYQSMGREVAIVWMFVSPNFMLKFDLNAGGGFPTGKPLGHGGGSLMNRLMLSPGWGGEWVLPLLVPRELFVKNSLTLLSSLSLPLLPWDLCTCSPSPSIVSGRKQPGAFTRRPVFQSAGSWAK